MLRLAEPPTGRTRLRSSLKSPRNPITPIETSRVSTLHPGVLKRFLEDMRRRLSEKSAFTLHMLHMLHVLHMSGVCRKKKIFGIKATGSNSFHRLRRSPSLEEGGLGFRRSRPPALPSIAYRGFAVAPKPLRAPSRKIAVITSGTNGRAMRAPTGFGGATDGCKCIQPLQ